MTTYKVYELFESYTFDQVKPKLLELYPEQETSINGYEVAYTELTVATTHIESDSQIHIYDVVDENDADNNYADVYTTNGDGEHYAIDFVDWREVLGMDIASEVMQDYTDLEALVHILFEITWYGYSNQVVQEEGADLEQTLAEIKQDIAANGFTNLTKSLEEILAELDLEE